MSRDKLLTAARTFIVRYVDHLNGLIYAVFRSLKKMESMPFLHGERVFTLFFSEDFSFADVREILDHLLDAEAFDPIVQENRNHYIVELEGSDVEVWVSDLDVLLQRL